MQARDPRACMAYTPLPLPIEEVLCRVRHARHFADEAAWCCGRDSAHRVHAQDRGYAVEDAWALSCDGGEDEPRDRAWISRAAIEHSGDDFAAADALPGWTCVVDPNRAAALRVGVQDGRGRNEAPARAVPAVDLHTIGVGVKDETAACWRLNLFANTESRLGCAGNGRDRSCLYGQEYCERREY